jgi:hypothetical protein
VARSALGIWWASRVALFAVVTLLSYMLDVPPALRIRGTAGWFYERFVWWDAFHFLRIADRGYLPPELHCCDQAFFPGYPFAIRGAGLLTGGNWVLAGLLVTQVAASAAVILLWLVAVQPGTPAEGGSGLGSGLAGGLGSGGGVDQLVGRNAVLLLAVTPFGIFLSSVYSEAMFLALCLGAWLAGLRRRWWTAWVLAGLAAATRVNGVFLAVALGVMYLTQLRADGRRRPRPDALGILLAPAAVLAYFGYLYARTGSWTNWQYAQDLSWHRKVAWPWEGLIAGWHQLVTAPSHDLLVSRAADLLTAVGGLLLTAVLLWRRRWAEAVFIGLNVLVLVASNMLVSSPRYALTWFPAYLMAARWSTRTSARRRPLGRWVMPVALMLGPPLLAVFSITFAMHLWVA